MNIRKIYNLGFRSFLVIFLLAMISSFPLLSAKAIKFYSFSDTISDSREGVSATHSISWSGSLNTLRCIKILFCTTSTGGCLTPTGLDSTSSSKSSIVGLTDALWALNNTSNGLLSLINSVGESPASNVSVEFANVKNPIVSGNFFVRTQTYSDTGCLAQVDYSHTQISILNQGISVSAVVAIAGVPPSGGGGGGGGGQITPPNFATVILKGKAYPGSYITILKNGAVIATLNADPSANFETTITGISPGIWNFGLWSEDVNGVKSLTLSFSASLTAGTITTFSGLFLPPTIDLEKDNVNKGEILNIFGYTYPNSEVNVFISSESEVVQKTKADNDGGWLFAFDTSVFETGEHRVRSKAVSPTSEISPFSQSLKFKIIEEETDSLCHGADLNFDEKVNLIDFSILLYFWDKSNPSNICDDINSNGIVDLADFSIMMYYWTD